MKQCPQCGGQVRDDAKFCGFCGHAFPQIPVTPQPEPDGAPIPQNGQPLKRKKSHAGLIIGVIAGILVLAGAITAAVLLLGNQKSTEPGVLFFRGDELWYADAHGERLAADPGYDEENLEQVLWNLAISDDGRWIYYPQNSTSGWSERDTLVYRDTLDEDSEPRKIDRDVYAASISASGDGSAVYYIRGEARTLCISDREEIQEIDENVIQYAVVKDGGRIYYTVDDYLNDTYELRCWENGESRQLARDGENSFNISIAYNTGDVYFTQNQWVSAWNLVEDDLGDSPEAEALRDCLNECGNVTVQSLWWTDGEDTECLSSYNWNLSPWGEGCSFDPDQPLHMIPRTNKWKLSGFDSLEELASALEGYNEPCSCELYLARGGELTLLSEDAWMGCLSAEGSRLAWLEDVDGDGYGRICTQDLGGTPEVFAEDVCPSYLCMQNGNYLFWIEDGDLILEGENLGSSAGYLSSDLGLEGFLYTYEDEELCLVLDEEEITLEDHLEEYGVSMFTRNQGIVYRNSRGEIYFYDRGEPRLLAEDADMLVTAVWSRAFGLPRGFAF